MRRRSAAIATTIVVAGAACGCHGASAAPQECAGRTDREGAKASGPAAAGGSTTAAPSAFAPRPTGDAARGPAAGDTGEDAAGGDRGAAREEAALALEAPLGSGNAAPFGAPKPFGRFTCPDLRRGGPFRSFLAAADTQVAFVDGNDWLALVNRSPTGALSPDYAPDDLVDVHDGKPYRAADCESRRECLRRDAAAALRRMTAAMRDDGLEARVQSSFRGFSTQCWVFESWARQARRGYCEATEQSALPGHSQHQLGTTLDLFTKDWVEAGARTGQGVFRDGFGCTRGGKWLDEHAWRFGFIVPYPIHPDDRKNGSRCEPRADRVVPVDPKTGYKSEPWHLRYVGDDAARRYFEAWSKSGPGSPDEITLEQWIRAERGLVGDTELPVCDGCQCGACATLASDDAHTPCGAASLWLDANGRTVRPNEDPHLLEVAVRRGRDDLWIVEARVHSPPHTPTQPPIFGRDEPRYAAGATFQSLAPASGLPPHRYPELPGAWRLAVEPVGEAVRPGWPWRASLAAPELAATWNRANLVLPAKPGDAILRIPVALPPGTGRLRVALVRDGMEHDRRDVPVP